MSSRTYTQNWEDSDWYYTDTIREEKFTKKCNSCNNDGKVLITRHETGGKNSSGSYPVTPYLLNCGSCGGTKELHYTRKTVIDRKSRRKAGAPTGW